MPSKKKKYNSRFPPARIKKIMQTDEDIGKVAAAVPVLISKCLEMFLASLLAKAGEVTKSKRAKTMSRTHLKECILSETMFDFLKDHVANIPDMQNEEEASGSTSYPLEKETSKKVVRKRSLSKPKKTPKKRPRLGHGSDEDTDAADDASENGSGNEGSDASFSSPGLLSPSVQRKLDSKSSFPPTEAADAVKEERKTSIHIPLDMLMSTDGIPASVKIEEPIATPQESGAAPSKVAEIETKPTFQTSTTIETVNVDAISCSQGSPVRKGVIVANTAAFPQPMKPSSSTNARNATSNEAMINRKEQDEADIKKVDVETAPTKSSDDSEKDGNPSISPQQGSMLSLLYSSVPMSLPSMPLPPTVQLAPSAPPQEKYAYSPLTQNRFSEPRQPLLYPSAPPTSNGGQGPSGHPYQYAPYTPSSTQRHYLGYPQAILTPPSHHIPNLNSHLAAHPSLIQVKPTPRTRSDDDDYDT